MVLSPLPDGQRERKFKLSHGDLIEEDDFEEDEDLEDFEEDDTLEKIEDEEEDETEEEE